MKRIVPAISLASCVLLGAISSAAAQAPGARPAAAKKAPEAPASVSVPAIPTLSKLLVAGFTVANVSYVNVVNGEMTFVVWVQSKSKLFACPVISSVGGASLGDIQVRNKAADNACTPMH